jgi:hypothetical protein
MQREALGHLGDSHAFVGISGKEVDVAAGGVAKALVTAATAAVNSSRLSSVAATPVFYLSQ